MASTRARSWCAGEADQGGLQDLKLVGVDDTDGTEQAAIVGQCGGHQPVGVAQGGGSAGSVQEGVAEGGVPGLALGGAEPDRQVDTHHGVGVQGLGMEVEGLGVVVQGVRRGERSERGVTRLAGIADGLGQVDRLRGGDPVTGQFAQPSARAVSVAAPRVPPPPGGGPSPGGSAPCPRTACVE